MKTYQHPSEITVGVVGYGGAFNMGRSHLQLSQATGMTPLAVAEVDASRLEVAKEEFPGIETYSSMEEMIRKSPVDLIVLITPHNTHAALALQCLKAGRHVVCEKPLAVTTAEVDSMIAAARKSDVMLSTFHNRHWDGRARLAVEQIVKKQAIGEVVKIECHMGGYGQPRDWWRTSRSISGGILYDWGVHLLEYSLQLIDDEIVEVTGFQHSGFWGPKTRWKADANEDEGQAIVRFKSGRWLTLTISTLAASPREGWITVTGTKGTWIMDAAHSKKILPQASGSTTTLIKNPDDDGQKYYDNIRDHLVDGADLIISAEWSRRPIHIIDLAVRSAQQGRTLKAKYA
jgi:scyllo-inositol 2-dehydrogenase (NADP+)